MTQINKNAFPQQVLTTNIPYAGPVTIDYAKQLFPNSQKRDYTSLSTINDLANLAGSTNPNLDNASDKASLDGKSPNYSLESSSAMPSDGFGLFTKNNALFDYNPEAFSSTPTTPTTTPTTKAVSKSMPKAMPTRRRDPMAEWAAEDIASNGLKDKYKAQYESDVAANAKIYPTGSSVKKTNGLNYTPDYDATQTGTQRGKR